MSKELGAEGEAFVAGLLRKRGYSVREIGGNYPVIDMEVSASTPFRVSVKTSKSRRQVRLGRELSVSSLKDTDFVFALLPQENKTYIELRPGGYDLLILPGALARVDSLYVHQSYLQEPSRTGEARSASAGMMVKGYSRRSQQVEVWRRWLLYKDRWDLLPAAA